VYYQLGQKASEIVSYFQALVLTREDDVATLWLATKNIGQTFGELKEYQKSIRFLQMALDIALENGGTSITAESWNYEFVATYLELGNTNKHMRRYRVAEEMYLKGIKIGAEAKSATPQLRYHETMIWSAITDLYLELSQWSKAEQFAQNCIDRYPNEQLFLLKLRNARSKTK
jgi:tetratricopeptide (TPR) repeat protein